MSDTWKHYERLKVKHQYSFQLQADRLWYHPTSGYEARLRAREKNDKDDDERFRDHENKSETESCMHPRV